MLIVKYGQILNLNKAANKKFRHNCPTVHPGRNITVAIEETESSLDKCGCREQMSQLIN